jgi:predicted transcriptional regulator
LIIPFLFVASTLSTQNKAERLRVKAELQKKNAKPATFKDSFAAEKEKQKALQKTKEERRNALCEELGRGC